MIILFQEQEKKYLYSKELSHPPYWDDFLRKEIELPLKQKYAADYLVKLNVSRSFDEED